MRVDAVALLHRGGHLALAVGADPAGAGDRLRDDLLGALLRLVGNPGRAASRLGVVQLTFGTQPGDEFLRFGELLVSDSGSLLEGRLGIVSPLRQGLFEVGGRLARLRLLLVEHHLGFLMQRTRAAVGVVGQCVGRSMRVFEDPSRLSVGRRPGIASVGIGFAPGAGDPTL